MTPHRAALASLSLCLALSTATQLSAEQVVFSEVMYHPKGTLPEFIEVQNLTSTPFDIALWEVTGGVDYQFPDFDAAQATETFLKAFERIVICGVDPATFRTAYGLTEDVRVFGPWSGNLDNGGERISLRDKNQVGLCTLSYNDKGRWPVAADGAGHSLILTDTSRSIDDYRFWGASTDPGGSPGAPDVAPPEPPNETTYIDYGDAWDYHDQNVNLGTTWRNTNYTYSHAGWVMEGTQGNTGGLYGFETSSLPDPGLQTGLTNSSDAANHLTYYFRKSFQFSGATNGVTLHIDQIVDDGAGYWLNGQWIGGVGTTAGASHTASASRTVSNASVESSVISLTNPPLVNGTNVLAVALKQTNNTSSDVVFGARLRVAEPVTPPPAAAALADIQLNEIHFDDNDQADWVELHNADPTSVDLNGLWLSARRDFADKFPLTGTIGSGNQVSFATAFPTNNGELVLFLIDATERVLDAVAVDRHPARDHAAAFPDGSQTFYASGTGTRDASNDPERSTAIVISELMVEPPTRHRDGEFVEIYNKSAFPVDLTGWRFDKGIDFQFPNGTTLGAGDYLVVAANANFTSSSHPGITVLGDYEGNLANSGERLRLVDSFGNTADEVHYYTGGDWPILAGGQGSSLELRHPDMDNALASAWADSDESSKSGFQTFTTTDTYEDLRPVSLDYNESEREELHLHAVGDAHLILRNIRLTRGSSNTNILPSNGTVVTTNGSGATGWLCQGTHHASHMVGSEFHLVSDGHGDVKANRCETDITAIQPDDELTLTFEARWVSGKPTLIAHSWDRSFGDVFRLPVPSNLGTPGASNSAAITSPVPTVSELIHSPPVPKANEDVIVTARITSATPLTSVRVYHRLDNTAGNNAWSSAVMVDDGATQGDEIAGDGIYTATLTSHQNDGNIVQFYVQANSAGGLSRQPSRAPSVPAMWVVDNGSIPTDLRSQRFVISAQSLNALGGAGDSSTFDYKFPRLSNHYFNATFIGDEKHIIYNCELRKSGSPWTRASGADLARAKWKPPGDRRFRGYSKRAIDNDAGGSRAYHNRIIRYWLYLFGHPSNENEFVRVAINGGSAVLREDVEPNANDFLRRNWEDGHLGELYRIDDEWWFGDDWARRNRNADWSYKDTHEPERYHAEWIKRSRETEYDYSSFINWVEAVGEDNFTREQIERMADIDMMAANAVVRGWCDDWDTLTRNRGKNGYYLKRKSDNRWLLVQWDSDLTFRSASAAFLGNLPGVRNFFDKPYVRQRFNYYLGEMIDKYTHNSPRLAAWLQCEEEASSSYSNNSNTYIDWNADRISRAESEIGSARSEPFTVNAPTNTSADVIDLSGTSPSSAFEVHVVGHPEADWQFLTPTTWQITGLQLTQGANALVVEIRDANGNVVSSQTVNVTKSTDALPVIDLDAKPGSWNVAVQDTLELDVKDSFDPEGSSLSFAWNATPAQDVTLTYPDATSAEARFTSPGWFTFEVEATDAGSQTQTVTREAAVYADSGWSSFSTSQLGSQWSLSNVELRDGSSPSAWYSLDDHPGKLTLKIEDDFPKPLTMNNPQHPILWQDLPNATDWSLHTDIELITVQTGPFFAGLIVEVIEGSTTKRFAVGHDRGTHLRVHRATGSQYTSIGSVPWDSKHAAVRIRRLGNTLQFDYQGEPGEWLPITTAALADGAIVTNGGLTASTLGSLFDPLGPAQAARFEFDYAMVVDPNTVTEALSYLRITELMYHPEQAVDETFEFIELMNISTDTAISLNGVRFEGTRPFDELVLGDVTLAPGERGVVVANIDDFHYLHGTTVPVLGQWVGGKLSNGGERVVLRDPASNVIHDFTYNDASPWPVEADGGGPSLEVINVDGNYDDPNNWKASGLQGTPGSGLDGDRDGLSDEEEAAYGTSTTNPDSDGDGMLDGTEVLAGTTPTDPNSLLEISSLTNDAVNGDVTTEWQTVPGKTYILQASDSLQANQWIDVGTITATSTTTILVDTFPDADTARRFYRIVLLLP